MCKVERRKFTVEEKQEMLRKTKGKCAHCGKKLTLDTMTVEHMYPLDKGGDNSEYNTVALCEKCNQEKSNFVYDMSYFTYIEGEECIRYRYKLMHSIYDNAKEGHIFGDAIRIAYFLSSNQLQIFKNSKKLRKNSNSMRVIASIGKKVEIRPLYPGDIDDKLMKFMRENTYQGNIDTISTANKERVTINKYALYELFRKCNFYGFYNNNELLGVKAYINIKNTNVYNEDVLKQLEKENYSEIYVDVVNFFKKGYETLYTSLYDFERDFMIMKDSFIIDMEDNVAKVISEKMKGILVSNFDMGKDCDYIHVDNSSFSYNICLDSDYEERKSQINWYRDYVNELENTTCKNVK